MHPDPVTQQPIPPAGRSDIGLLTQAHPGSDLRPRETPSAWAQEYAQGAGWPVFLLGRTKRPVPNCPACRTTGPEHDPQACSCLTCHGFYAATTDPGRIRAMFAAVPGGLLAVRTGASSRLLVVDIDPAHGGELDQALMPPTLAVATGGGGWHLYYRHPGTPVPSRPLPGHPGVDIKADGGYVVAPPSVHPRTRRRYAWSRAYGQDRSPSGIPPALLAACTATTARPAPPPPSPATLRRAGGISRPDALLAANLAAVARAPQGRRYVTLYGAARGVARMVAAHAISAADARAALVDAGRQAGQSDREIRTAIDGGFRAEGVAA